MTLRVIMLGDIVGHSGLAAVLQQLPAIRERWQPHLIIANAENVANGSGLTPQQYRRLIDAGIDGITLGDHVFKKKQIAATLESESNIIRPANLSPEAQGKSWMRLTPAAGNLPPIYVMTVLGRLFMSPPADDPFAAVARVTAQLPDRQPIVLVEAHAEATSEKQALAWHLCGKVAAVIGTHTHVATADARILRKQTAYISDLGMCGPQESVLGRQIDRVLKFMTTAMPAPFDTAEGDPCVCGVCIDIDPATRRAVSIERIELAADRDKPPFVM